MKRLISGLLIASFLGTAVCAEAPTPEVSEGSVGYGVIMTAENPVPAIAERIRPAVVEVTVSAESWDPVTRIASVDPVGLGSACYILKDTQSDGGYVLTNYHVVSVGEVFSLTWLSGETCDAELVGYDDGTDIAVLKFTDPVPEGVEPIAIGDSDSLQIGELAICIGNPGYGGHSLFGTVTVGVISGLDREDMNASNFSRNVNVIQTDAAINTGSSGGALVNAKGELVGIPTLKMMFTPDVVFEGLGFCIPINTVKLFIDQIIDNGRVTRPRLGITITEVDGPDDPMRKYPPAGLQVAEVEAGNPSEAAGIRVQDIITEVNGVRVKTILEMLKELDKCSAGDTVELKAYRYYDQNGELTGTYEELFFSVPLRMID